MQLLKRSAPLLVLLVLLVTSSAMNPRQTASVDKTLESHVIEATRVSHMEMDQTNVEKAVREWEESETCNHDYFNLTPDNLLRSKSDEWYSNFIDKALEENREEYERLGELQYFAKHSFSGQDMRCGVYSKGCEHQPSCETILRYTVRRNRDMPRHEAMDLARKIYHSQKKIVNIGKAFYRVHENMGTMASLVGLRADEIINDFSPAHNPKFDFMCKVFKQAHDTVTAFVIAAASDAGVLTSVHNTMIAERKAWLKTMIEAIHQLQPAPQSGNAVSGMGAPSYGKGSCWGLISAGQAPDDEFARGRDLKSKISQYSSEYRSRMSNFIDSMMKGKEHDNESPRSMLHTLMLIGDWSTENGHLEPAAATAEKKAQDEFTRQIVMGVLANMKCYVKCANRENENGNLCTKQDQGSLFGARTCFDDGYSCQAQCWTSLKGHHNHEIPLIGAEKLAKYGITLQDIVRNSHEKYQLGHQGSTQKSIHKAAQNGELYGLPTCKSSQIRMGDVDNKMRHNKLPSHRRIPCTCGDWRSNETAAFMREIGLGSGQSDMLNRDSWQTMERICGENLRDLHPLNRFLSYCELGTRFPYHWSVAADGLRLYNSHSAKSNMVDPRCDTLKRQIAGMNEGKANAWFCQKSEDAKKVFKDEKPIQGTSNFPVVSHYRKCKEFNKKYTYETMADW